MFGRTTWARTFSASVITTKESLYAAEKKKNDDNSYGMDLFKKLLTNLDQNFPTE